MASLARADIAIVGAGPAGAWTACALARSGARVLLFDHSHPREKPCGGGVTSRAMAIVASAVDARTLPSVAVRNAIFEAGDGTRVTVALGHGTGDPLRIASRRVFDAALADAAVASGASLIPERVVDVRVLPDGVDITCRSGSYRCGWIVGADGANSLVRRRVWQPFRRDQLSIATGVYADGVTAPDIIIRFTAEPPGYIWSFPRPDHLAIGICAEAGVAGRTALHTQVSRWIEKSGIAPGAKQRAYAWPIPSLRSADFSTERFSGSRWLLVGDAAGLVDPITREGIFFALESASHACAALAAGGDAASAYDARLRDTIVPELRRAARLKQGFFRPRFIRLMVDGLSQSESIRRVMADLVAGEQPYATLARRLVATLEVRLAMKLVKVGFA